MDRCGTGLSTGHQVSNLDPNPDEVDQKYCNTLIFKKLLLV